MADRTTSTSPDPADGDDQTVTDLTAADGTPLAYAEAIDELEAILAELDAGSADVDRLADRVKRAADLVRHCRARLGVVRSDVDDVVGDLAPAEPAPHDA